MVGTYEHPWLAAYHRWQAAMDFATDWARFTRRRHYVFRVANPYATGPRMIWVVDSRKGR